MLRNYFIVAIRNFLRNKLFSFINVFGLAIAMAASLIIFQYVWFEFSFDKGYKNQDRMMRLAHTWSYVEGDVYKSLELVQLPFPATERLVLDHPEIESYCQVLSTQTLNTNTGFLNDQEFTITSKFRNQEYHWVESNMLMASSNFLDFFGFELLNGNATEALSNKHNVAISQEKARQIFGDRNPIGQIIELDGKHQLLITSVIKEIPTNFSIRPDFVVSIVGYEKRLNSHSYWNMAYLMLKPNTNKEALINRIRGLNDNYFAEMYEMTADIQSNSQPYFVSMSSIREGGFKERDPLYAETFSRDKLRILFVIGLVIIFIGWVNYSNIITASSLTRLKEMAMRKVMGAGNKSLMLQIFLESLVINLVAFVFAVTLVQSAQPLLNDHGIIFENGWQYLGLPFWGLVTLLMLLGTVLSATFPALNISRPDLKGQKQSTQSGTFGMRKSLLLLQFLSGIGLVSILLAIDGQVKYVLNADMGFNSEAVLAIKTSTLKSSAFENDLKFFTDEVLTIEGVTDASSSSSVPGEPYELHWSYDFIENVKTGTIAGTPTTGGVDHRFVDFYGVELIAGRSFNKDQPADKNSILLSKIAAERIELSPEDAIGRKIRVYHQGDSKKEVTVIGVYKDLELKSYYQVQEDQGSILTYGQEVIPKDRRLVSLKITTSNLQESIPKIEELFRKTFPESTFDYFFIDDKIAELYTGDIRFKNIVSGLSLVAILISSMGLFGLVSIVVVQKTREIGIRKVLGAKFGDLYNSIGKSYITLVFIAFILSLPMAYLIIDGYLDNFRERMDIGYELFLLPFLGVLILTMLIIFSRVFYVARLNPSESLRYE
ncbi:MAG: FtsX-like permease family protein [Cyclobacteriaceae bacterium]